MIFFDTDVISELMRPRPSKRLVQRIGRVPAGEQATTAITLGELRHGAAKAGRPELYVRALQLLAGISSFDFDRSAAEAYGDLRATLERAGKPLADPDLRIAAIVLANEGKLVTGNVRHFARIAGLDAEDWIR